MFAHFSRKRFKIAAAIFVVSSIGAARAEPPIVKDNAQALAELNAFGHVTRNVTEGEEVAGTLGFMSDGTATQTSIAIDSKGTKYVAYAHETVNNGAVTSAEIYVVKLVNNRWVSAAAGDGFDNDAVTIGDVVAYTGDDSLAFTIGDRTEDIRSITIEMGPNDRPILAYIHTHDTGETYDGTTVPIVNHQLRSWELDEANVWQPLSSYDIPFINDLVESAQYLDLEINSKGDIYVGLGTIDRASILTSNYREMQMTVVKLSAEVTVASDTQTEAYDWPNQWQQIKEPSDSVVIWRHNWIMLGKLAISPSDQVVLATTTWEADETLASNGANTFFRVEVLNEADNSWSDFGTGPSGGGDWQDAYTLDSFGLIALRSLDIAFSPSGTFYAFVHDRDSADGPQFIKLTDSGWEHVGITPGGSNKDLGNEFFGTANNLPPPEFTSFAVDSNEDIYLAFGDPGTADRLLEVYTTRDDIDPDTGEPIKRYGLVTNNQGEISAGLGTMNPQFMDIAIDPFDQAHIAYIDRDNGNVARAVRLKMENTTDAANLSISEGTFAAGSLTSQIDRDSFEDVSDYVSYVFDPTTTDYDLFDSDKLTQGIVELKSDADGATPTGAGILQPAYELAFYAETNGVLPEQSNDGVFSPLNIIFAASTDPDVIAARGFLFGTFRCDDDVVNDASEDVCVIEVNEGDTIGFEFIKSRIGSFTIDGAMPEGITFDETDPASRFEGNVGFNAVDDPSVNPITEYPLTVTAHPEAGLTDNPIPINLIFRVQNTEASFIADYSVTIQESETLVVAPDLVAIEQLVITYDDDFFVPEEGTINRNDRGWIQFNTRNGRLEGDSRYIHAGTYSGYIEALGYDGEVLPMNFTLTVENVPLTWNSLSHTIDNPLVVSELPGNNYMNDVINGEFIDILNPENSIPYFQGVFSFSVSGLPDYATADLLTGNILFGPRYDDATPVDDLPQSFSVTAFGWDEEVITRVFYYRVINVNALPDADNVIDVITTSLEPVSIDIVGQVTDADGEDIFLFFAESENFDRQGAEVLYSFDPTSREFTYSHVPGFPTTGFESPAAYGHDGLGTLTPTQNGFVYTPAIDDNSQVNVNYVVTDEVGMQAWQEFLVEYGEFSQFADVQDYYRLNELLTEEVDTDLTAARSAEISTEMAAILAEYSDDMDSIFNTAFEAYRAERLTADVTTDRLLEIDAEITFLLKVILAEFTDVTDLASYETLQIEMLSPDVTDERLAEIEAEIEALSPQLVAPFDTRLDTYDDYMDAYDDFRVEYTTTSQFSIEIDVVKEQTFDQRSSGGSTGGLPLLVLVLLACVRLVREKV